MEPLAFHGIPLAPPKGPLRQPEEVGGSLTQRSSNRGKPGCRLPVLHRAGQNNQRRTLDPVLLPEVFHQGAKLRTLRPARSRRLSQTPLCRGQAHLRLRRPRKMVLHALSRCRQQPARTDRPRLSPRQQGILRGKRTRPAEARGQERRNSPGQSLRDQHLQPLHPKPPPS